VRFEVHVTVKIQVEILWFVMLCSVVVAYHCYAGPCFGMKMEAA